MGIERFDAKIVHQLFGVTKLPMPQPPARTADYYPPDYRGSARRHSVLVGVDLDAHGKVQRVEALPPPALPPCVGVRSILVGPDGRETHIPPAANTLDPLFASAAETSIRAMRFTPAERNGEPVAFSGLRMTVIFSDPQLRT